MNLLHLDTSTPRFSQAVSSNGRILSFQNVRLDRSLSSSMVPHIDRFLSRVHLTLEDIDGFAVGLGPGSFTSLRVGLVTVKAFAFAWKKPLVGVSSLDLLAMNVSEKDVWICPVCDARRNMVFAAFYRKKDGRLKRQGRYWLAGLKDVLAALKKKRPAREIIFLGDGLTNGRALIEAEMRGTPHRLVTDERAWWPQARRLLPLVEPRFMEKKTDDPARLVPLYLYPEDCQVRKAGKT